VTRSHLEEEERTGNFYEEMFFKKTTRDKMRELKALAQRIIFDIKQMQKQKSD
jgi:hypothetical protein